MIIQCDKCATRYRLDESKVTGPGVKVRCTKCQNVFMVAPPPVEEARIEEAMNPEKGKASAPRANKEEKPARPAAKKALDNETLRFNFDRPPDESPNDSVAGGTNNEKSPAADASPAPDFGLKSEVKEEPPTNDAPASGRKGHFEDLDFSFGGDANKPEPAPDEEARGEEWTIGPGKEDIKSEDKPAEPPGIESPPAPLVSDPPVKVPESAAAPAAGHAKEGNPAAGNFEDILSSISDGGTMLDNVVPAAPPRAARSSLKYYIIAGAIVLAAAAAFHFTGGVNMVTGKILSHSSGKPQEEPVRIDTVRGFFVDNRNIGRVFVIEAWIKNISDSPQDIKEVRGVLYNNSGERIKVQAVSPGRVISLDDIKNLSKDDILKQYKDVSGGTVPPRGAVPVTIVFTDIPKGMSEYGVDIVRNHS